MTLCDTGPLVALINRKDHGHTRCVVAAPDILGPLFTTWPCFTEAMFLLGKYSGYLDQEKLWSVLDKGALILHATSEEERVRMRILMRKYRDAPMDLADASLVAAAEALNVSKIFTLDKHFHAYRIHDKKPFEVVP